MTDLQKYQISPQHAAAVRASGFDARDPDARHPVRNPVAERILAAKGKTATRDPRVAALMRAKDGLMDRVRGRGLGLLLTTALATASALPALAGTGEAVAVDGILDRVLTGLGVMVSAIPGPRDPVWTPLLLGGLLATQIFPLIQKRPAMPRTTAPEADIETPPAASEKNAAPMPRRRWRVDGASRTGKVRSENQDACRMLRIGRDRAALILCDGAGGIEGGKLAAETAASRLAEIISAALDRPGDTDWPETLEKAITEARRAVDAEEKAGITTAIVAVLEGDRLHYATLGDGALSLIWPAGKVTDEDRPLTDDDHAFMVQELLAPHHIRGAESNFIAAFIGDGCAIPPRIGAIRCEPGCLLLAMSDGAGDLLSRPGVAADLAHYALCVANGGDGASLAEDLLRQLEAARDPKSGAYLHSDNMTLLLATLDTAGGDHA